MVGWHCDSQAEEEDEELRGVACKRFSGEGKWSRKPRFVGVGVSLFVVLV